MAATVQEEGKKKAWYLKLVADLKAILLREEHARIQFKHEIGKRILQEKGYIEYGDIFDFMKQLGEELNYGWRDLYYCVEFAQKYPSLDDFFKEKDKVLQQVAKAPTWRDVVNVILPKGMEKLQEEIKPKEVKLCELEELLQKLSMIVHVQKDQMLNCAECEIKADCDFVKSKLSPLREKFGD